MAITFNQQSVAQANPNTSTLPVTTPRITEEILNQIRDDQFDEIFYVSTDPASNKLYAFLNEIYGISPNLLIDDSETNYTIATSVGITVTLGGLVYDKSARDLKKLTYLLAFRAAFRKVYVTQNNQTVLTAHPENFESWWEKANGLRFLDWSKKYSDPSLINFYGAIIKRLCKNGEEEIWTGTGIPNSEIDPPVEHHLYNTKSKYDYFGIDVDSLLISQGFWNNPLPPIEYYWLGQTETPYFGSWIEKEKSKPFIPTNNLSNPYISENFDSVILTIPGFDLNDYYVESTGLGDEKQLPRIISILDASINKVEVRVFNKKTKVQLFYQVLDKGPDKYKNAPINRNLNGEFYISNDRILYTDPGLQNKLEVDFLNGEEIFGNFDFDITNSGIIGFCKKLIPEIKQATVQIPGGLLVSLQDMLNVPAEKDNSQLVVKIPRPDVVIANNASGRSGITIAHGVDIGNGLAYTDTESTIKTANENWLEDYLTHTSPAWYSLSPEDKEIVKDGINRKGSDAEKYWILHRALFESLNLEDNALSPESVYNWKNALLHLINFYEDRYYGGFPNQFTSSADPKPYQGYTSSHITDDTSNYLKARTLKRKLPDIQTMPNVIEKYVILALMINYPPSILSYKQAITEAINQHSLKLLTNLLKKLGSINNNVEKIKKNLFTEDLTKMKPEIIEYYNSIHYAG